jgi:transcriptional regulator with XRE-family HTH domain
VGQEHELARLILARKNNRSYDDLARRSGLNRATIHRLTTAPMRNMPDPTTIVALARGLEVSVDRVAVAALRSAGVPVTDRFATGGVLDGLDRLTPAQRAAVEHLVRVMLDPTSD